MAKYKALVSFSGVISAAAGSEIEIKNKTVIKDLLKAGYIKPIEAEESEPEQLEAEPEQSGQTEE